MHFYDLELLLINMSDDTCMKSFYSSARLLKDEGDNMKTG